MVSIIIPMIRPEGAKRCTDAIYANAEGIELEILVEEDTKRIGCPKMVKQMVEKSKGDTVCFLGDDTVPQPGFLSNALVAMQTLPDGWGLVGLNDQHSNGNKLATHWLADKRLLPFLDGEFFHTGYFHRWCDIELMHRCKQMGRYVWARNAKIAHLHPAFNTGKMDTDYERVYGDEYTKHDHRLFWVRSQNNWQTPGEKR